MAFELHTQLAADTAPVTELTLCTVRLMNCRAVPWLILVPRRENVRELTDLGDNDRQILWSEITTASRVLQNLCKPHKLNVAALGNVVSQLHVHLVARFESDAAWPKPVWGNLPIEPYEPQTQLSFISDLKKTFDFT